MDGPNKNSKTTLPNDGEFEWKDARLAKQSEAWSEVSCGYQWPASKLSRQEMAKLTVVSNYLKRPLTQLIRDAVNEYANKRLIELNLAENPENRSKD